MGLIDWLIDFIDFNFIDFNWLIDFSQKNMLADVYGNLFDSSILLDEMFVCHFMQSPIYIPSSFPGGFPISAVLSEGFDGLISCPFRNSWPFPLLISV